MSRVSLGRGYLDVQGMWAETRLGVTTFAKSALFLPVAVRTGVRGLLTPARRRRKARSPARPCGPEGDRVQEFGDWTKAKGCPQVWQIHSC